MSNSKHLNGKDRMRDLQLQAFAMNLCALANRHRDGRNYAVARALYSRAIEVARKIDSPEHKKNGVTLVARIEREKPEVGELLQHEGERHNNPSVEKAQKVGH